MKIPKTKRRQKIDSIKMKLRYQVEKECRERYDSERVLRDEKFESEKKQALREQADDYSRKIRDLREEYEIELSKLKAKADELSRENEEMRNEFKEFKLMKDSLEMTSRRFTKMIIGLKDSMNKRMSMLYQEFAIVQEETEEVIRLFGKKNFKQLETDSNKEVSK